MGTGFSKKKKEAKLLQQQFSQLQSELKSKEVQGSAGNGLVTLTLSGDGELKKIKIKPECVDPEDVEGLESLIKAAYTDAQQKINSESSQLPNLGGLGFGL
jgi:DNA-binding YbaB/EbfC family protein